MGDDLRWQHRTVLANECDCLQEVSRADRGRGVTPLGRQVVGSSFVSWEIAQKANRWSGQNVVRCSKSEYDRLWKQAATELDPVKRAALFIAMNDLLIEDVVVIPLVWRHEVVAVGQALQGLELSTWDSNLWDLAYWYRQT